jgi:LytS/YehU family sensor histidine kinase
MEELLTIEQNRKWNYSLAGFITILILVIIFGTFGYGYLELRKKNHLHSEIKYRLLLSQLYPRFVLESINSLKTEIQSDRIEESGTKLSDFARLIRTILINPLNNFHLLERELNSMESYFSLQKMRFNPKFDYSIDVDPQIDPSNISIPPFLGHLLVEAWIALAIENNTQNFFINSRFSLHNGILTQTFDTNIPFINQRLYGSLPARDNLGTSLQLLKTRFLLIQKKHSLKIGFQLTQTIATDGDLTHCHVKLSIPLLPHASYPAIKA